MQKIQRLLVAVIMALMAAGCTITREIYQPFKMDDTDFVRLATALETTPDKQTVHWASPQGLKIQVTPIKTDPTVDGERCRDYTMEIIGGAGQQNAQGVACRNAQGWRVIKHTTNQVGGQSFADYTRRTFYEAPLYGGYGGGFYPYFSPLFIGRPFFPVTPGVNFFFQGTFPLR